MVSNGQAYLEVVHRGLNGSVGDLAVVDDNGVTASAALVESPANALGELGLRVGKEKLQCVNPAYHPHRYKGGETHNVIVLDPVGLTPGAHDVGIVVGQDGNNVDTLLADLGELGKVFGDVVGSADGGEGTGEGEEDDLLVGPLLRGLVVDGDTARGDLRVIRSPGDIAVTGSVGGGSSGPGEGKGRNAREDDVRGERVTSLDARHCE